MGPPHRDVLTGEMRGDPWHLQSPRRPLSHLARLLCGQKQQRQLRRSQVTVHRGLPALVLRCPPPPHRVATSVSGGQ